MMEVKCADVDVIAADAASPARLLHQDLLDPATVCRDALRGASRTSVEASRTRSDVVGPAVGGALPENRRCLLRVASAVVERLRAEAVLPQPVLNRREAQ